MVSYDTERGYLNLLYLNGLMWHRKGIFKSDTWMVSCDTEKGYLNIWYLNGFMWHREGIVKSMIPEWFDVTQRGNI